MNFPLLVASELLKPPPPPPAKIPKSAKCDQSFLLILLILISSFNRKCCNIVFNLGLFCRETTTKEEYKLATYITVKGSSTNNFRHA